MSTEDALATTSGFNVCQSPITSFFNNSWVLDFPSAEAMPKLLFLDMHVQSEDLHQIYNRHTLQMHYRTQQAECLSTRSAPSLQAPTRAVVCGSAYSTSAA